MARSKRTPPSQSSSFQKKHKDEPVPARGAWEPAGEVPASMVTKLLPSEHRAPLGGMLPAI